MFSKIAAALLLTTTISSAFAEGNLDNYRSTIIKLVDEGYYYSVIPWMKDYLVRHNASLDSGLERSFDKLTTAAGIKIFESMPI